MVLPNKTKPCIHINFEKHYDWFDAISADSSERIAQVLQNASRYVNCINNNICVS